VVGWSWLAGLGAASLLPGLGRASRVGGLALGLRVVQALLAGVLLWRHPVPALWILLVPLLVLPWRRSWWAVVLALAPAVGLVAIGVAAWWRGAVNGVWLAPWEIAVAFLTLALAFLGLGGPRGAGRKSPGRKRR
jgi:hypothetical protein